MCIRNALCVGAFEDEDIIHVEGCVDPVRDIEIIHEELRMKDEEMIGPIIDKLEKTSVRGSDKKLKPEYVSELYIPVCIWSDLCRIKTFFLLCTLIEITDYFSVSLLAGHHV